MVARDLTRQNFRYRRRYAACDRCGALEGELCLDLRFPNTANISYNYEPHKGRVLAVVANKVERRVNES
jgi:hypothetical protein